MGKYLNVGNDSFAAIRKGIYVDKTELISFINSTLGSRDKLTCVTRPRRFGKSFAAQMLCAYYDKSCDSGELFKGLAIEKDPDYEKHLNKYNVIYLDMTWFIANSTGMDRVVSYLQSQVIKDLRNAWPEAEHAETLPRTLCNISRQTGTRFVIIIDEWDALFREARDNKALHDEYMNLLRRLFRTTFTDTMIEAAYMTGILPINRCGYQWALSDFWEYTVQRPGDLAKYVGFTEEEVKRLCETYDADFQEMKSWYDGYSFRQLKSVYCPYSVMQALKAKEFGSYWVRTESSKSLKRYLDWDPEGLKEAVADLLSGKRIRVDAGTFLNDLTGIHNKDEVITLLIHLGYLTYDSEDKTARIPNREIRYEFLRAAS